MRHSLLICALAVVALASALPLAPAEEEKTPQRAVEIETERGVKLAGAFHPARSPNGTAVVIAPGQGYHMDLPLITKAAERLSDEGFAVVRFNWAYFAEKGKPAQDLSTEQADLEAVIAFARATDGIEKIIIAGKSLGSLVALNRSGEKHDDLAGVALLTFPLHNPGDSENLWVEPDDIDKVGCPVAIFVGDQDPLAELGPLYSLIGKTKRPAPIVIAPGEHSFRDPGKKDDKARTAEHLDVIVDAFVLYCRRWAE